MAARRKSELSDFVDSFAKGMQLAYQMRQMKKWDDDEAARQRREEREAASKAASDKDKTGLQGAIDAGRSSYGSGGGGASGAKGSYTPAAMADLIRKAGGTEEEAKMLGAIGMAESRGVPTAHNTNADTGDNSHGLWQINMLGDMGPERLKKYGLKSNEDLFDPQTNARVALQMARERGGYDDWSVYKKGAHTPYLKAAAEPYTAPAQVASNQALPVPDDAYANGAPTPPPRPDDLDTTQVVDAGGFSRGGMVSKYADGGMVEDPPLPPPRPADLGAPAPAAPAQAAIPTGPQPEGPPAISGGDAPAEGDTPLASLGDALKAGFSYLQNAFGLQPAALPGANPNLAQGYSKLLSGAGALPPAAKAQYDKEVDPKGELTEALRDVAGLVGGYNYLLAHGRGEEAKKMAGTIIQTLRAKSAYFANKGLDEAQAGKWDEALKSIVGAANSIPDGTEKSVEDDEDGEKAVVVKDMKTGAVVNKIKVTPQSLLAAATRMRDGKDYYTHLMNTAEEDSKKKDKTTRPSAIEQHEKASTAFGDAYSAEQEKLSQQEGPPMKEQANPMSYEDTMLPGGAASKAYQKLSPSQRNDLRKAWNDKQKKTAASKEAADEAATEQERKKSWTTFGSAADTAVQAAMDAQKEIEENPVKKNSGWLSSGNDESSEAANKAAKQKYANAYYAAQAAILDAGVSRKDVDKIMSGKFKFEAPELPPSRDKPVGTPLKSAVPVDAPAAPVTPQGNAPAAKQLRPLPEDQLAKAKGAIARGADPAKIKSYLESQGYASTGL